MEGRAVARSISFFGSGSDFFRLKVRPREVDGRGGAFSMEGRRPASVSTNDFFLDLKGFMLWFDMLIGHQAQVFDCLQIQSSLAANGKSLACFTQ